MKFLIILGELIVPDDNDYTIEADSIWVRGKLTAGSPESPFQHKLNFILKGNSYSDDLQIDQSEMGNKYFLVTGEVHLYGSS